MSKSSNTRSKTSSTEGEVSYKDKYKQTTMGNYQTTDKSPTQRRRAKEALGSSLTGQLSKYLADQRSTVSNLRTTVTYIRRKDKPRVENGTKDEGGGNRHIFGPSFFRKWSDKDTEQYRLGYPGKKDYPNQKDNLKFYTGKSQSHPDGDFIDNIHENWWGEYRLLESHHGYIQWLFPIRESGMNFYSQELQLHEIQKIKEDKKAHARVLKSYRLMLDFYGMELEDEETGIIKRGKNWRSQFQNLNRSFHNYLRITRILKSLGEFGYEYLKRPFVEFVLQEALETGELHNVLESCVNYWIGTIKDDGVRKELLDYIEKVEGGCGVNDESDEEEAEMEEVKGRRAQSPKNNSTSRTSDSELSLKYPRVTTSPDVDEFSDNSHEGDMWAQADLLRSLDGETGNGVCDTDVRAGPEEDKMEVDSSGTEESNAHPQTADPQAEPLIADPHAEPLTVDPQVVPQTADPQVVPQTADPQVVPQTADQQVVNLSQV